MNPYESEVILSTLTMSDLDELKPFIVDDMIIAAAEGKINGMSSQDVANLMTHKITTVFEI